MQSDLLEQAIIDATALKEAAIKNAENTLIEKYSHEFQQTVEKLLEQEAVPATAAPELPPDAAVAGSPLSTTPDAAASQDMTTAPDASIAPEVEQAGGKAFDRVPSSFLDGDENEKIIINFDQIKKTMMEMFDVGESLVERDLASVGETIKQDAVAPGAPKQPGMNAVVEEEMDEELDLDEMLGLEDEEQHGLSLEQEAVEQLSGEQALEEIELDEEMLQEVTPEDVKSLENKAASAEMSAANLQKPALTADVKAKELRAKARQASGELEVEKAKETTPVAEDIEITEEELMELAEQLKVDIDENGQGRGWMGAPAAQKREQRNVELAATRDDKKTEAREEEMEKMQDLVKENADLKQTFMALKGEMQKMNLLNAKLLYTNKALGNISLNERQKNQIVESISKADSVLAAKTIYETVQNAVENTPKEKEAPQSLREALNRANSPFVVKKSATNSINDVMADRLKALAGIKTNK